MKRWAWAATLCVACGILVSCDGSAPLVAIDACVLVGEGRLLSLLAARGVVLTPLHETE